MSTPALLADPLLAESWRGAAALARLTPELERLEDALGVPLTSRARWARAAFAADPSLEPWAIVARDRAGHIDAAVVLGVRRRGGGAGVEVSAPRPGSDDELRFMADSTAALEAVVSTLAAGLAASSEPWTARLTGLAPADPATTLLTERLPNAVTLPGDDVPGLRLSGPSDVTFDLRKDVRRSLRRSHARLTADAVRVSTQVEDRPERVLAALAAIETAHRERDHDAGRPCSLDDGGGVSFWRRAIEAQAARGAVEITLLRFDDALAAYLVAFPDPPAYRVFDARCVTRWARYTPGHLLEAGVLSLVAHDSRFTHVDWMSSAAPEKLVARNMGRRSVTVVAAAGAPIA